MPPSGEELEHALRPGPAAGAEPPQPADKLPDLLFGRLETQIRGLPRADVRVRARGLESGHHREPITSRTRARESGESRRRATSPGLDRGRGRTPRTSPRAPA